MDLRSIEGIDVSGKRVVLRSDLNVPVSGSEVEDTFRLARALPTLEHLAFRGARVIIVSHLGRHGDSLEPVFEKLRSMTSVPLAFCDTSPADALLHAAGLKEGTGMMLQNIRRDPGEEENDAALAASIARLGDLYVNDAFADSHRAHASIVGVPALVPAYAGLLMIDEVRHLEQALTPPEKSMAIIGGAKFETKEPLIRRLFERYETVCVGGALADDFLKAKGFGVGTSLVSDAAVPQELLASEKLALPVDVLVGQGEAVRTVKVGEVAEGEQIVDAGEETAKLWSEKISKSEFVLWNGPLGIYEQGRVKATDTLAEALARSGARAAVGGGDTLAALGKISFDDSRVFRSTGGGAMLEFLVDGTLPGLEPLKA